MRCLREYREGWKRLQHKWEMTLDVSPTTNLRLHGTILGRCDIDGGDGRFHFLQIPSETRKVPLREWTVTTPQLQPCDFELDINQNLLVIMEQA